jgi:fermentation-respiration switch protein FrsA (DUF1100 family)
MSSPYRPSRTKSYPYGRVIRTGLLASAVVVFTLFVCTRWIESHAVFYPSVHIQATPAAVGVPYEEVTIPTVDGIRLNAWFVRSSTVSRAVVIYCHGNGGNIGDRIDWMKAFYDMGLNVLLFDYRGYGRSTGRPTEEGVYQDAVTVYDYLVRRPDVDRSLIAAYGESLGGAVAVDMAVKRPLAGLVIDGSFTSAQDMADLLYPGLPTWFMTCRFDSVTKVRRLTIPKLFFHNRDDTIIPFAVGKRLFDAAAEPKLLVPLPGEHGSGLFSDPERYKHAFQSFMASIGML